MKILLTISCLTFYLNAYCQKEDMATLLNFPVGGTWVSENTNNDGDPESFTSFCMNFETWLSQSSVTGNIYGIRNNRDTVPLIEVWNFLENNGENAFLVQHTMWGEKSTGTVVPYEGQHLDIQFISTTASGETYYTRDIHYITSKDEMKAVTYQKKTEDAEWQQVSESYWKRIK